MRSIRDFNSVIAPITEFIKKRAFELSKVAQKAFEDIKQRLCKALVLALPNREDLFELECDVNRVRIRVILIQSIRPITYFNEKFNDSRCNYNTDDQKFYVIMRTLTDGGHYLKPRLFVMHSDHQALKYQWSAQVKS